MKHIEGGVFEGTDFSNQFLQRGEYEFCTFTNCNFMYLCPLLKSFRNPKFVILPIGWRLTGFKILSLIIPLHLEVKGGQEDKQQQWVHEQPADVEQHHELFGLGEEEYGEDGDEE
jgi:hypothetical protein